jgi:ABC-type uncharacterized transport system permease subunit
LKTVRRRLCRSPFWCDRHKHDRLTKTIASSRAVFWIIYDELLILARFNAWRGSFRPNSGYLSS